MSAGGRNAPLSPISLGGTEWSKYPDDGGLPTGRSNLASPPVSAGSNGIMSINGFPGVPRSNGGGPSPPASIGRSSMGTTAGPYSRRESGRNSTRENVMDEAVLGEHYIALRAFLNARDPMGMKQQTNKARDKLLRLSSVQFYELSTDVFDELVRRQAAARAPPNAPNGPPAFLLPEKNFHPKRNQARQRLSSLGPPRFKDLAADVYHELERRFPRFVGGDIPRGNSSMSMRSGPGRTGTPVNGNGYPGRPRMRQPSDAGSMRGPPPPDAYGIPPSPGLPPGDFGRPMPRQLDRSNTIVPNKSTMVEEDDDGSAFGLDGVAGGEIKGNGVTSEADQKLMDDYQSQIRDLQEKLEGMEDAMKKKENEFNNILDDERSQFAAATAEKQKLTDLRLDLENKVAEAQSLNDSMKQELDRVRDDHEEETRHLRDQMVSIQDRRDSEPGDVELQRENDDLRNALREQQQITEEVRHEAHGWLSEMRTLSQQSEARYEKQLELERSVEQLEQESREWRSRYARARAQMRNMRASSVGLMVAPEAANLVQERGFTHPNGIVKDVHVTRYQISVDEFLQRARTEHPDKIIDAMKSVVASVRRITKDVDESAPQDELFAQQKGKLKAKVASTANNLITASKNFAAGAGLSPVSLLDAAASHLTAAVVELLRGAKIRPTPAEELEEEDDGTVTPVESAGFFSPRMISGPSSVQDSLPPPPPFQGLGGMRASADSSAYSPINSPRESVQPSSQPINKGYGYAGNDTTPSHPTNGYGHYHQEDGLKSNDPYDFS